MARSIRSMGIPGRVKRLPNPVADSPDVLAEARAHFADHCALCHGNDGSGNTELGQSLYPKAPDMRLPATQSLTDGELYYIIQNGVRLTGMPAWGMKDDHADEDSWKLVHFIRHLSELTPEQLKEMEKQNPRNPAEIEEEREEEEFLGALRSPPRNPGSHRLRITNIDEESEDATNSAGDPGGVPDDERAGVRARRCGARPRNRDERHRYANRRADHDQADAHHSAHRQDDDHER
jgi:mono/diheme cytochrome c family protein